MIEEKTSLTAYIDATLEQIDKGAYVNICTILQILISVPISSASCERSISTL